MTRRPSKGTGAPPRWLTGSGLAVVIVALILASTVVVLAFTKDDGAPTSEQATRDLLAALEADDLLTVLESLPPGERKVLRDGVVDVAGALAQVGLLTSGDLHRVDGPKIEFTDVLLRTSNLSKDMDAVDLVGGSVRFQLPAGDAPLTDAARHDLEAYAKVRVDPAGMTLTRDFSAEPLRVVAIREGGGWHVSLAYSVAELVRSAAGAEFPEMGKGPPSIGANAPDEVVSDLFNAYANGDSERLVTLTHPDESRALYDYTPSFQPHLHDLAMAAAEHSTYDVQLNHLNTVVEGTGSTRTVRVTQIDLEIRDQLKKAHLTFDGRCLHLDHRINDDDAPYESWDRCDNDPPKAGDAKMPLENPVVNLSIFGGGVDLPSFVVVERGGRWFLSPARTVLDSIVSTLRGRSPDDVDAFAQRLADSVRAGAGEGLSGHPIEGDETIDPSVPADDPQRVAARAKALVDGCAALTTGDQAADVNAACLQRLIATGRLDPATLPPSS